jgi:hypothetical protein
MHIVAIGSYRGIKYEIVHDAVGAGYKINGKIKFVDDNLNPVTKAKEEINNRLDA